tara:strand:+ start:1821 stop:2093 length:273 start_codon:yes stop_codon:yes gene_type:complete
MKKVKLSITDTSNNLTYAMGHDKNDESILIVSINKPYGVTASAVEINDIFADTYQHFSGTASVATKVEGTITALLLKFDLVRENLKYQQD